MDEKDGPAPAFELIVLGASGGPLETHSSGYMLKAVGVDWKEGWVGLEGGSGIGSLASLLDRASAPTSHRQPVAQTSNPTSHEQDEITVVQHDELPNTPGATPSSSERLERFQSEEASASAVTSASRTGGLAGALGSQNRQGRRGMFPGLEWPADRNTAVLQAGWLFSFLSCYLITHAHFDHIMALVLSTGSLPPRALEPYPPGSRSVATASGDIRTPVYASRTSLGKIARVFSGDVWPELGEWAEGAQMVENDADVRGAPSELRREVSDGVQEAYPLAHGCGVQYCPLGNIDRYQRLPTHGHSATTGQVIGFSTLHCPVSHGATTKGIYESSAYFIRLDTYNDDTDFREGRPNVDGPEILFWGDVDSKLDGEDLGSTERDYNEEVWRAAAVRWDEKRLRGVFIECSYSSNRPSHLMFGHLRPQSLHKELSRMAAFSNRLKHGGEALAGLPVYIMHTKQPLLPEPDGQDIRARISGELQAIESEARSRGEGLGVDFIMLDEGMRLLL